MWDTSVGYEYGNMLGSRGWKLGKQYQSPPRPITMFKPIKYQQESRLFGMEYFTINTSIILRLKKVLIKNL